MDLSAEKGAHMEAQPGSFRGLCLYNPPPVLPNDRRIEKKDSDLPAADRTEMPVRDEGIQDASLGVRGRRSRWHRGTRLSALRKPSASVVSSTLMGRVSDHAAEKLPDICRMPPRHKDAPGVWFGLSRRSREEVWPV